MSQDSLWEHDPPNRAQQNSTIMPYKELKVSVCMAAFNGGKYIEIQLRSILPQLGSQDEVLIVDDRSDDDTVARIRGMRDGRIRLIEHKANQGVVATVEDALRLASGDILFLSDDDDIWAENKVKRYLEVFRARPDVQIVTSRVRLIDNEGNPYADDRIMRKGEFSAGFWRNVYKNRYQGSAMAIKASLLQQVLPFPVRPAFLHDQWIGTRNAIAGGKTAIIEEELLFYRRHSNNFSRRLSPWNQLRARVELLWAHASYAIRSRSNVSNR
jgi:glycosyltransferase involved in cell wall biosynthesis